MKKRIKYTRVLSSIYCFRNDIGSNNPELWDYMPGYHYTKNPPPTNWRMKKREQWECGKERKTCGPMLTGERKQTVWRGKWFSPHKKNESIMQKKGSFLHVSLKFPSIMRVSSTKNGKHQLTWNEWNPNLSKKGHINWKITENLI